MDFTTYEPRISAIDAGGGGGGDSDFSTAEITINNTKYEDGVFFSGPFIYDEEPSTEKVVFIGATLTVGVILYKGLSGEILTLINGADGRELVTATSVTGGVESLSPGYYTITGDGTITF